MTNDLLLQSRDLILQLTNELERITPKAKAYDKFIDATGLLSGSQTAGLLKIKYHKKDKKYFGSGLLYRALREFGYMRQSSTDPTQVFINMGYATVTSGEKNGYPYTTPRFKTSCLLFLEEKFAKEGYYVEPSTAS